MWDKEGTGSSTRLVREHFKEDEEGLLNWHLPRKTCLLTCSSERNESRERKIELESESSN